MKAKFFGLAAILIGIATATFAQDTATILPSLDVCEDSILSFEAKVSSLEGLGWKSLTKDERTQAVIEFANFGTSVMSISGLAKPNEALLEEQIKLYDAMSGLISGAYTKGAWLSRDSSSGVEYLLINFMSGSGGDGANHCTVALTATDELQTLGNRFGKLRGKNQAEAGTLLLFSNDGSTNGASIVFLDTKLFTSVLGTLTHATAFVSTAETSSPAH